MAKRYYWLRLKEDFFEQKIIKKLRRIAGGDTYTIIYLKLQLLAMKNEGKLFFEYVEDDFAKELALELDENELNVSATLYFLEKNGLMELISKDEYFLPEVLKVTGSESASTQRVREFREREKEKKLLQCNADVTSSNKMKQICSVEKEKESYKESYHDNNILNNINIIKELFEKFGVNFSKKHYEYVSELLKKNSVDYLVKHFTKQYEILKAKSEVKNIAAVFSNHLFNGTCEINNSHISKIEKEQKELKQDEFQEKIKQDKVIEYFLNLTTEEQKEIEDEILKTKDKNLLLELKKNSEFLYLRAIYSELKKILNQRLNL